MFPCSAVYLIQDSLFVATVLSYPVTYYQPLIVTGPGWLLVVTSNLFLLVTITFNGTLSQKHHF